MACSGCAARRAAMFNMFRRVTGRPMPAPANPKSQPQTYSVQPRPLRAQRAEQQYQDRLRDK